MIMYLFCGLDSTPAAAAAEEIASPTSSTADADAPVASTRKRAVIRS